VVPLGLVDESDTAKALFTDEPQSWAWRSDAADRSTHILILVTREGVGERGDPEAQAVELSGGTQDAALTLWARRL
jgi:hypothetical protein